MALNPSITPSTKPSAFLSPIFTSKLLLMSFDKIKTSNTSKEKNKRELAWKVAPNLIMSFRYAWAGVSYAFTTQRNFRIHTAIASLAVSLGIFLHVTNTQMAIIVVTCAMVMVMELLNTALESVVDLTVKQTYHELAKIAKDCAAGAVLISAVAAVLVAAFILMPPLWAIVISEALKLV